MRTNNYKYLKVKLSILKDFGSFYAKPSMAELRTLN